LLNESNEGQEEVAVEASIIETFGRRVRCHDNHGAPVDQSGEQARDDRGIGDILDLQFVEAEQARLSGDGFRQRFDRLPVWRAAKIAQPFVHFAHEGVEVNAPFARLGRMAEEHVHEKTFAATCIAP
jgi:hypothetical protein